MHQSTGEIRQLDSLTLRELRTQEWTPLEKEEAEILAPMKQSERPRRLKQLREIAQECSDPAAFLSLTKAGRQLLGGGR